MLFFGLGQYAFAQKDSLPSRFQWGGLATLRSMQTVNQEDLTNFYATVTHVHVDLSYQTTPWLKFNASGYGLMHLGTDGIIRLDPSTLSGPIYEANLWNPIWMDGKTHFELAVLNAEVNLGKHKFIVGRHLFTSPIINPEPWPFPDASEGIFYHYGEMENLNIEAAWINRFATRFDAQFRNIGDSFGRGGNGFRTDGGPSRYLNNVSSDFIAMMGVDWQINDDWHVAVWDQYVDNVMNNVLIETKVDLGNDWSANAMFIQQFKVNDGGNPDPIFTYLPDERASYLGLRLNKVMNGNLFQFNYSRFFDQGRLQLTRDWGLEPFYTFQRRTRLEGIRDAHSIMFKWQRDIKTKKGVYRYISSVSRNWLPFPGDYSKSKYRLPSHSHLDLSMKYTSTSFLKGMSAEIYLAYRFLAEDLEGDDRYLINRANIFHTDFILSYTF